MRMKPSSRRIALVAHCRFEGAAIPGWTLKCLLRATVRRVKKLVGDVRENRGMARRDSALSNEPEEPCKKLVDVDAGVEFEFGEELSGKVLRVVLKINGKHGRNDCLGMTEARAGMYLQAGKATALAVGIKIRTARGSVFRQDCNRISDGAGANGCCAHELFLSWWGASPLFHA